MKYTTNYSYRTSLPAWLENKKGKDMQERLVLYVLSKMKRKKGSLKEVQEFIRKRFKISLPQSTISGRMNDLRDNGKVGFFGETKIYNDRLRKVFEVITSENRKKKQERRKPRCAGVKPSSVLLTNTSIKVKLSNGITWITRDSGKSWAKQVKKTNSIKNKKAWKRLKK